MCQDVPMDEVTWGPGTYEGPDVSADRRRSAVLLARLGGARRSTARRLSFTLLLAGFLAITAGQLLPWARLATPGQITSDVTSDRSDLAREVGIADGQTILQFSYYITLIVMLALCGGAVFASRRTRRVMAGTALGSVAGHLLLLLPMVGRPARLYGYVLDSTFGDNTGNPLKVIRDLGMWLSVGGALLLAVAIGFGLLSERLPATGPAEPSDDDRLSDHDRPSSAHRPADDAPPAEVPARRAAAPARTPSNQFAFEGHADLPVEAESPTHPDHSIYQRPRQDTDLRAR
jgi:hypothetical protein